MGARTPCLSVYYSRADCSCTALCDVRARGKCCACMYEYLPNEQRVTAAKHTTSTVLAPHADEARERNILRWCAFRVPRHTTNRRVILLGRLFEGWSVALPPRRFNTKIDCWWTYYMYATQNSHVANTAPGAVDRTIAQH